MQSAPALDGLKWQKCSIQFLYICTFTSSLRITVIMVQHISCLYIALLWHCVCVCAAKLLGDRFSSSFDSAQQLQLEELFSLSSVEQLLASDLVNKFRSVVSRPCDVASKSKWSIGVC